MTKKVKTKRKSLKKKFSKNILTKDKSIIWALIFGVALAAGVILYIINN